MHPRPVPSMLEILPSLEKIFDSALWATTQNDILIRISWQNQSWIWNSFMLWIRGLGRFDLWKNQRSKISLDFPFKVSLLWDDFPPLFLYNFFKKFNRSEDFSFHLGFISSARLRLQYWILEHRLWIGYRFLLFILVYNYLAAATILFVCFWPYLY
jgi:hypothetical protein